MADETVADSSNERRSTRQRYVPIELADAAFVEVQVALDDAEAQIARCRRRIHAMSRAAHWRNAA